MTSTCELLRELIRGAPFQPATNLWRVVELDAVQRHGLPGGRGLDLGCGDGKLTGVIARTRGPAAPPIEWTGVDIDPQETAQAEASGLYRRVHTASATTIPESDESFDFVFSNSVLEHIGPIDAVLGEVSRLLKPGGRLICTVPGPQFHACLAGPLLGRMPRADYERDVDTRCAHLRYWDEPTWALHLQAQGLGLLHASRYLTQRQLQRWERVSACTGGLAYRLFGSRPRPIEIQRRLRLRDDRQGLLRQAAAVLGRCTAWGCALGADASGPLHACLLIEAVKGTAAA